MEFELKYCEIVFIIKLLVVVEELGKFFTEFREAGRIRICIWELIVDSGYQTKVLNNDESMEHLNW